MANEKLGVATETSPESLV